MNKKARAFFMALFGIFASIIVIISIISFFKPNDNYHMSVDALVNNLRNDTQNYTNVNRGREEAYKGKSFTISGEVYGYDSERKFLIFDSLYVQVFARFNNLSPDEEKALRGIKRGYRAEITGKFSKESNFIIFQHSKLNKLIDQNNKYLLRR